ncbi:MAG: ParB/RepB/Spo0J family partition protein [Firmicutes bacterium]|nr:ParB/RepB/Spo0J family partition protein [Bacillota bacterium]
MAVKRGLGRGLDALFGDNTMGVNDSEKESDLYEVPKDLEAVLKKHSVGSLLGEVDVNVSVNNKTTPPKIIAKKTILAPLGQPMEETQKKFDEYTIQDGVMEIPIQMIFADPNQPRKSFDDDALLELTNSIRTHGVITPLVVVKKDTRFMIVAGERRFRASQRAGLTKIPCIVKKYTQKQIQEIGLVDNLQRENLNAIETANAIQLLMEEYHYTQEEVADRIGKSRPSVANTLRLLKLSPTVIEMIRSEQMTSGHARCIVPITDVAAQIELAQKCVKDNLSVRDFEVLVKNYLNPPPKPQPKQTEQPSIELVDLINKMKRIFGTKVTLTGNERKGRISIDYFSSDDLDRFVELVEKFQ